MLYSCYKLLWCNNQYLWRNIVQIFINTIAKLYVKSLWAKKWKIIILFIDWLIDASLSSCHEKALYHFVRIRSRLRVDYFSSFTIDVWLHPMQIFYFFWATK